MVLAESMCAGVVPIAYNADGRAYILEGFPENLVPFGEVEALAAQVRDFVARDLAPLRRRLRKSIADRFSPEVVGEDWRKLLQ